MSEPTPRETEPSTHGNEATGNPESFVAPAEPFIDCPKCHTHNAPSRVACLACGARLLRGRSPGERIAYVVVGVIGAAFLAGLSYYLPQRAIQQGLDWNPLGTVYLGGASFVALLTGIGLAIGRTPSHEQYVKRAERHQAISPDQALADLTTAIEIAPKKQKADILRRRSDLYARMGRRLKALDDLSAYAASDGAHAGSRATSEAIALPVDSFAEGRKQGKISGMQQSLVRDGHLLAIGYCAHCKDVTDAGARGKRCIACGNNLKDVRYVRPLEREAEAHKQRTERQRRRVGKLVALALAALGIVAAVLICNYAGVFNRRSTSSSSPMAAPPTVSATTAAIPSIPGRFDEEVFSFEYPPDWLTITDSEIPSLLAGSLKGMDADRARYIGGVWTGGISDCAGCAQIVVVVLEEDAVQGQFTQEQYEAYRHASEARMGDRLISTRYAIVGGLPGAEVVHIGASERTKLWDLIVVPPQPGLIYSISCSALKEEYDQFEKIFAHAFETLRFAGGAIPEGAPAVDEPTPLATEVPATEPAIDVTGCRLGAIFQADVSVPDGTRFTAGDEFVKTWRVRNTGSCPWGAGYRLFFVGGDHMGGPDNVLIPETAPGADAQVSVDLVAPQQAGRYRGAWQVCVAGGQCFGDRMTVVIRVTD